LLLCLLHHDATRFRWQVCRRRATGCRESGSVRRPRQLQFRQTALSYDGDQQPQQLRQCPLVSGHLATVRLASASAWTVPLELELLERTEHALLVGARKQWAPDAGRPI